MPTVNIICTDTNSGQLIKDDATWTNVTNTSTADSTYYFQSYDIGCESSGGIYTNDITITEFDLTTVVPEYSKITSATLYIKCSGNCAPTGDTLDVILYDYGGGLPNTSAYLSSTEFSAESVVASLGGASFFTNNWYTFTSSGLAAALVPNQSNRICIASRKWAATTAPTVDTDMFTMWGPFATAGSEPYLRVTYVEDEGGFLGINF